MFIYLIFSAKHFKFSILILLVALTIELDPLVCPGAPRAPGLPGPPVIRDHGEGGHGHTGRPQDQQAGGHPQHHQALSKIWNRELALCLCGSSWLLYLATLRLELRLNRRPPGARAGQPGESRSHEPGPSCLPELSTGAGASPRPAPGQCHPPSTSGWHFPTIHECFSLKYFHYLSLDCSY